MARLAISSPSSLVTLLGVSALIVAGCGGGDAGRVAGRVNRKTGEPLEGANVTARCEETGKSFYGTTDADGKYDLSTVESGAGMPPGTYSVVILEKRGDRDSIRRPTIAAKYSNPAQSGLTFTLAAGETKSFDVTVDPP